MPIAIERLPDGRGVRIVQEGATLLLVLDAHRDRSEPFTDLPIPQVWRRLHAGADAPDPVESAFCQARDRLGVPPLRRLFEDVARPMATHQTVGASYRGWRLMGLDGTALDLPDTPDNACTFGRPTTGRAEGAFAQVRLLALCELGTPAVCGLAIKPICPGGPSMGGQFAD